MFSKVPQTHPFGGEASNFRDSPLEQVRTLFVGFIQGLFYSAPVGAYHWTPDDSTEIVVTDESPVHVSNLGQRPAVCCTRGPVQFFSLGLDDMMSYNIETSTKSKSVLVPGTMSVNCLSRLPLESERIAWIIAEQLWAHRELLMREGFFEVGRMPVIGSPSPAGSLVAGDQGDELFVTVIQCPFQFYRTTSVTPLNQAIAKNVTLSLRSRLNRVGGKGFGTGVAVDACYTPSYSDASDVDGNTPSAGDEAPALPLVPHPLNPAQLVHVRIVRPFQQGIRAPQSSSDVIPISRTCVPESPVPITGESQVKV